jgi:hypothetical protein
MKRYCLTLTHAALFAGSSLLFAQQPPPGAPGAPGGERGERPQRGPRMVPPILAALDADKDGTVSAEELANASAALATLDKNSDGKLTAEEIHPTPARRGKDGAGRPEGPPPGAEGGPEGPGGPPPGAGGPRGERGPRMKPPFIAALDADDDQVISAEELAKASAALAALDKNTDGKLTPEELMPRGPRGPRGEGGGRRGPGGPGGEGRPSRGE